MDVDECTDVSMLGTAPWLAVVQGNQTFDLWNVRASTIQVIFYKLEESGGVVYIEKGAVIRCWLKLVQEVWLSCCAAT